MDLSADDKDNMSKCCSECLTIQSETDLTKHILENHIEEKVVPRNKVQVFNVIKAFFIRH